MLRRGPELRVSAMVGKELNTLVGQAEYCVAPTATNCTVHVRLASWDTLDVLPF